MSDDRQPGGELPDELHKLAQLRAAEKDEQAAKDAEIASLRDQVSSLEADLTTANERVVAAEAAATAATQRYDAVLLEVRNMLGEAPPSEASPKATAEATPESRPDDNLLPEHRKRQVIIEAVFQERFGMEPSEFRSRTRGTGRMDARDIAALIHREAGTPHAEVASMLDTSPGASHSRTSKAGQRLENELPFSEEYGQTKKLVEQLMDPAQHVTMDMGRAAQEVRKLYANEYGVEHEEYTLNRRRPGRSNARRAMAVVLSEAGVTPHGIAMQLGRPEEAVKTMTWRARNQLTEDPKFLREVTRIRIRAAQLVIPVSEDSHESGVGEDSPDDERLPEEEEAELGRIEEQHNSRVADTLREVLSEFEVTLEDVQGNERDGALVKARSAIFSILFEVEKLPPEDIMQLIQKDDADLMFRLADQRQNSGLPEWMEFNETVEEIKERIIAKHGFGEQRTVPAAEIPPVATEPEVETDDAEDVPPSEATAAAPYATDEAVTAPEREEERRMTERLELTPALIARLRSQNREAVLAFRQMQEGHIQRLAREHGFEETETNRVLDSVTGHLSQLPTDVENLDNWVRSHAEAAFMQLTEQRSAVSPQKFYEGMKYRYDSVGKQNKVGREDVESLKRLESNTRRLVAELVGDNRLEVPDKRTRRDLMRNTARWIYKLERVLMLYGSGDAKDVTKPLHQMPEDFQREVVLAAAQEQLQRLGSPRRGFLTRS